jgi:acyl carrier protein
MDSQICDSIVAETVMRYIMKTFRRARQKGINANTSLLEFGVIDSLGMLDLVAFLEAEFGISIAEEELTPENFQTVSRIGIYVRAKQSAGKMM